VPANLPPQYFEAEKVFRAAKAPSEKIEALETMLAIMPKHKGTDHLKAELRARIAKLTDEIERLQVRRKGHGYHLPKEGAGQVALVGLANSGKSALVAALTQASPRVADYPYTTQEPVPGMLPFEDVQLQLVDMPAIDDRDARPWLNSVLRHADLLALVVDLSGDPIGEVEALLEELAALRIEPWDEQGETQPGWVRGRVLVLANKRDRVGADDVRALEDALSGRFPLAAVSALTGEGLDGLAAKFFHALEVVRVYTKAPGQSPDMRDPVMLPKGSTVEDAATSVHKELRRFKYAQVWGSGKFQGQRVPRNHVLQDLDIIEIHA